MTNRTSRRRRAFIEAASVYRDAVPTTPLDGEELTAYHEAGHVWARWHERLPFRYVTLSPRNPEWLGLVAVRRRSVAAYQASVVALAGPLAESIYLDHRQTGDFGLIHPDDIFDWALMLGGGDACGDASQIADCDLAEGIFNARRRWMLSEWSRIEDLADELVARKTLRGREAFEILDRQANSG